MPVLDRRFTVDAPIDAVRAFHRDTSALKLLTPPPAIVRIHEMEPLGEGSVSRFTVWFGPLPIRWTAVHSDVGPDGFTDTQAAGPCRRWVHTHRFTAIDETHTEVHDRVEYEYGVGIDAVVSRLAFNPLAMRAMFAYRAIVTKRKAPRARA